MWRALVQCPKGESRFDSQLEISNFGLSESSKVPKLLDRAQLIEEM
jgi:hypothetical protein